MGKTKKGRQEGDIAGLEENHSALVEQGKMSDNDAREEKDDRKNDPKKSKKLKKTKKTAAESDDDGANDLAPSVAEVMKKTANADSDDIIETKSKKQKGGDKSGPVGFSLLTMEDDEDDIVDDGRECDTISQEVQEDSAGGQQKSGKGKKSKVAKKEGQKKQEPEYEEVDTFESSTGGKAGKKGKKKKKTTEEDDEIERMLAELNMEYSGQKQPDEKQKSYPLPKCEMPQQQPEKKGKKKKIEETTETVDPKVFGDQVEDTTGDSISLKIAGEKKKNKKSREKPTIEESVPTEESSRIAQKEPKKAPHKEADSSRKEDDIAVETLNKSSKTTYETPSEIAEGISESSATAIGESKKKKPNKAALAVMQERLKAIREEEERLRKAEEEKALLEEQAELFRLEQLRLEQEKKDLKKQREKERRERLKAEGKLLTTKQKQDRARAQAMLEALKAQGIEIPEVTAEKRIRPGTRIRPKKNQETNAETESKESPLAIDESTEAEMNVKAAPKEKQVKESWDASDSEHEKEEEEEDALIERVSRRKIIENKKQTSVEEDEDDYADEVNNDSDDEEDGESDEDFDDDEDSDSGSEVGDHKKEAEKMRQRALDRISKRTQEAEKKRTLDNLRAAVVCVLGHVDTGKTKILDKLRRTNVQDGEAGGITQQIGATNVPVENIKEQTKFVKGFVDLQFRLPGLLIIDTPGHESFSNLRSRGSSLCDIAILVVDIMHGLEPQTIESINLLKSKRTPFVVALNKIDRLYDWNTMARKDVREILKSQASNTQLEFTKRTNEIIVQFAEQGLNAALFYENPDPKTYVSLVPTSAITGEGMGNLLFLIVQFCQKQLAKRLMYSEDLQATVLEVKAIPGLGTTIDAILINGVLHEGDTMILAGTEGPIVTQIKALLMPQPMKELRVKNAYIEHREITAAQGVKIAAKELEKAIAGLNLQIAMKPDEVEFFKEIVARDLKSALSSIKLSDRGVYVQASTLGSLEALLEFLRTSKIPYSGIRIGPVVKRDVMKASTMLEHENQYATILAFDVKVERDAQDLADNLGVKIFQADIIYHLFDKFMAYREEIRLRKRDEFKSIAVFPCKLKILPQFVFNSRDPIVMGVIVEAGVVKEGTPICVPSKEFTDLGVVTSIEANHKQLETARKGQEVCIKIEPIPGETPKMFGRHFDETDLLVSKISRQSIDACKDYFRDDLLKSDWTLMVELKKTFQIL
ncbi:eukaryotic translation initiation factor 5B [Anopheles bellator]|uniref:eukaryotic translation initiation factor 5B n=1 Tax=Anopheles bellator TaxID=139047 RepID=UPI002647C87F|nr:eukaryotic translation initiation factor 5B [Anopheles bellator]